jgi:hypothetical protein
MVQPWSCAEQHIARLEVVVSHCNLVVSRSAGLLILGILLGCGGAEDTAEAPLGTLVMPLASVVDGIHYQLEGAFFMTGPVTGRVQENGSGTILVAALPEGDYEIDLRGEWTLKRQAESGGMEPVDAELVSPNPRPVHIESGQSVTVAWIFETDGFPLILEPPGLFQGNLTVIDSSNPAHEIFGDVLLTEQSQVDALAPIDTISGSLTISGSVSSLASLAALTQIEGDLSIVDSGGLNDLAGLEGVAEIGGELLVLGNASLASVRALASLTTVDAVSITDNVVLPTCEASWLVDNITITNAGAIEPGGVVISGNDDSGTCP